MAGACVGSFLATVARRWGEGPAAALTGRSSCDSCGTVLGPLDLVPILSRIALQGRCRHCRAPIPLDETWIEAASGLVAAVAVLAVPSSVAWVMLAGWLLVLLAAVDHFHGLLPDLLNGALLLAGLLALLVDPMAPQAADGLAGGVLGAAAFAALALGYQAARGRSGLGGGDIKLMGALGVWVGLTGLAWVVLVAAASALAASMIAARGRFEPTHAIRFGPWLGGAGFVVLVLVRY